MNKISLIVAHSKEKQGAKNKTTGETEYNLSQNLVFAIRIKLIKKKLNVETIWRNDYKSYREMVDKINSKIAISFHFNSCKDKNTASGTELIIGHDLYDNQNLKFLKQFPFEISDIMGIRDRGIKFHKDEDRGGYLLFNTNSELTFIMETCFINNNEDMKKYRANFDEIVKTYADLIYNLYVSIKVD